MLQLGVQFLLKVARGMLVLKGLEVVLRVVEDVGNLQPKLLPAVAGIERWAIVPLKPL